MERYTAEDMYLLALLECVVGSEIEVQKKRTFAIHAKMDNKQAKRLRSLLKHALKTKVDVADDGGEDGGQNRPSKKVAQNGTAQTYRQKPNLRFQS